MKTFHPTTDHLCRVNSLGFYTILSRESTNSYLTRCIIQVSKHGTCERHESGYSTDRKILGGFCIRGCNSLRYTNKKEGGPSYKNGLLPRVPYGNARVTNRGGVGQAFFFYPSLRITLCAQVTLLAIVFSILMREVCSQLSMAIS